MTVKYSARPMNVSKQSVYRARLPVNSGCPDVVATAERGELTLNAAPKRLGLADQLPVNWQTVCRAFLRLDVGEQARFLESIAGRPVP